MPILESLSKLLLFDEREDHAIKQYIQIEIAIIYLRLLKRLRQVFIYTVGIILSLITICIGLSYLVITTAISIERYLPASVGVSIMLIAIPALIVGWLLLQSTWIRAFGADHLLNDIEKNRERGNA